MNEIRIGFKRMKQMADEGKTVENLKREIQIAELINKVKDEFKRARENGKNNRN